MGARYELTTDSVTTNPISHDLCAEITQWQCPHSGDFKAVTRTECNFIEFPPTSQFLNDYF